MASRRTQPYRRENVRTPGAALGAMLRGRPAHSPNPRDQQRLATKRANRRAPGGRVTPYASLRGRAKRARYNAAFKNPAQQRLIFALASQGVGWAIKHLRDKGMNPPKIRS